MRLVRWGDVWDFWPPSRPLKDSHFVSGHRFSDAVRSSKSDAPLGAGRRHPTLSAPVRTSLCACSIPRDSAIDRDLPPAGSSGLSAVDGILNRNSAAMDST